MIFDVSPELWDKVVEIAKAGGHPFSLGYNRKFMQDQFDNIQRLIDSPPPAPSAPTASLSTHVSLRSGSAPVIGATVVIAAATAVAGVQLYRKRRAARSATKPAPEFGVPPEAPELDGGGAPMSESP